MQVHAYIDCFTEWGKLTIQQGQSQPHAHSKLWDHFCNFSGIRKARKINHALKWHWKNIIVRLMTPLAKHVSKPKNRTMEPRRSTGIDCGVPGKNATLLTKWNHLADTMSAMIKPPIVTRIMDTLSHSHNLSKKSVVWIFSPWFNGSTHWCGFANGCHFWM